MSDSAVLKVIRLAESGDSRWPASPDPAHPYYWRREPLAYESGVIAPFGVPRVRASVERADGSIALWLEDGGSSPAWTPELLGDVARRLGRAQSQLLDPPPSILKAVDDRALRVGGDALRHPARASCPSLNVAPSLLTGPRCEQQRDSRADSEPDQKRAGVVGTLLDHEVRFIVLEIIPGHDGSREAVIAFFLGPSWSAERSTGPVKRSETEGIQEPARRGR